MLAAPLLVITWTCRLARVLPAIVPHSDSDGGTSRPRIVACRLIGGGGSSHARRCRRLENGVLLMLAAAQFTCQSCRRSLGSAHSPGGRCSEDRCDSIQPSHAYAHRMQLPWPQAAVCDPQHRNGRDLHVGVGGLTQWTGLVAKERRRLLLVARQTRRKLLGCERWGQNRCLGWSYWWSCVESHGRFERKSPV